MGAGGLIRPSGRRLVSALLIGSAFVFPALVAAPVEAATVFVDGFESGDLSSWSGERGFVVQETTVRSGGWAGRASSTGGASNAWRSLPSTHVELFLSQWIRVISRSTAVWTGSLRTSAGSPILLVGVSAAGKLAIRNAPASAQVNSGVSIGPGVWHRVELHAVVAGTSGRVDVWLDGSPVPELSLQQNLGTTPIGRVLVGDTVTGRTYDVAIDDVLVTTDRGIPDEQAPNVPSQLSASPRGATRIDLTWSPSTDDVGVVGYTIYRALDSAPFAAVGTSGVPSFIDSGLTPETSYSYVVDAFDAAGNRSDVSETVIATTGLGSETPPNVVLILTDDQPADTIDRMPVLQTHLVGKGVDFTNGVVSNSLCCPSRTSILRGQYSHTTGIYDNGKPFGGYGSFRSFGLQRSTLGAWLDGAGYRTGYMGKLMNGYSAKDVLPGFDYWAGTTASYYNYAINVNGVRTTRGSTASDYHTTVLTHLADQFIRDTDSDRPLYLQIAPYAPHAPYTPAPEYSTDPRCEGATNTDAISFNEADVSDKPLYIRSKGGVNVQSVGVARPIAQCRTLLSVDDLVATVLGALEDTGRMGNTLIVYMSDNGLMNGEHRWPNKEVPYEGAIRVPLVMRYDPVTEGIARSDDHLVANIDIAPTFIDLAGVDVTPGCPSPPYGGVCDGAFDGRSILPLLRQEAESWRPEGILLEHFAKNVPVYCGVRTSSMKYVRYTTGEEELYDLSADAGEMVNLLGDGSITGSDQALRDGFRTRLFGADGWCRPAPPEYILP